VDKQIALIVGAIQPILRSQVLVRQVGKGNLIWEAIGFVPVDVDDGLPWGVDHTTFAKS
jgi:hypothetical protein